MKYLAYGPKSQGQERCHGWPQDLETPQTSVSCFIPDFVEAQAEINFHDISTKDINSFSLMLMLSIHHINQVT